MWVRISTKGIGYYETVLISNRIFLICENVSIVVSPVFWFLNKILVQIYAYIWNVYEEWKLFLGRSMFISTCNGFHRFCYYFCCCLSCSYDIFGQVEHIFCSWALLCLDSRVVNWPNKKDTLTCKRTLKILLLPSPFCFSRNSLVQM